MSQVEGASRPQIHLLATESDQITTLALQSQHRFPVVAALLLEELERAELHEPQSLPSDAVTMGSHVTFIDERTRQLRNVELVYPAHANISEGKVSILTPVGAALFGLRTGNSIDWPDIQGHERRLRIVRVIQPNAESQ